MSFRFTFQCIILIFGVYAGIACAGGKPVNRIEQVPVHIKDPADQIALLLNITDKLKYVDPDQSLAFAKRALELARRGDFPELKLRALIEIGNLEAFKTQLPAALNMALQAKELATRLDNKKFLAEACLITGMIKIFQGDYSDSYESYFTALRLFEGIADASGTVKAMNGIGNICYYQRNFDKAFIYYTKALKIAREHNDTIQIANVQNNLGLVHAERNQVQNAIACFDEAIAIHIRLGLKSRLATNYINLSTAYLQLRAYDKFMTNYQKAVEIYTAAGSQHNLAMCYLMFHDYFKQIHDPENQRKYAFLAYSDGMTYKLKDIVSEAAEALHQFYLENHRIDSAYKYAMIQHAEQDSIDNEHSSAKLTLLEMEYNDNKRLKEDKIRQQRRDFITIIMIILGISGLVTITLFLSRQIVKTKNIRLEKMHLSDEVDFKNKELTINVMNLIKKNELILDISNQLVKLELTAADPAIKREILQLINSLQRHSSEDIWEEFETRFRQVHNSFYERLLARFPDLSPNELKLCALLRLNLSTKEICELSGQRPSSLDVARYRLRKKLGISNSQVNLVTFLSQV